MPILYQGELICILYLENSVLAGVFTQDRITILEMLSAQAAVSVKNATLYENLEQKVKDRTREIEEKRSRSADLPYWIVLKSNESNPKMTQPEKGRHKVMKHGKFESTTTV